MPKNYYLILGITADASAEDIKTAFRRRALELHPDRSGLESAPFQEAQEAYSVLSDPERRQRYDWEQGARRSAAAYPRPAAEPLRRQRQRAEPLRPVEPAWSFCEFSPLESFLSYRPSFDELFDRFWGNFEDVARPKAEKLESLTMEVLLSPEEAAWGGQVRVRIPARATCRTCGGHGWAGPYECWRCEGRGSLTVEYPVDVTYPAGLRDGVAVRVPLSHFGIENLYLTVLFRVGQATS